MCPCPIPLIPGVAEGTGTGVGSQHRLYSQHLPRLGMTLVTGSDFVLQLLLC